MKITHSEVLLKAARAIRLNAWKQDDGEGDASISFGIPKADFDALCAIIREIDADNRGTQP